jgi:hypothetical protein
MATLHIEHRISDLQTWLDAFGRFEEARQNAGVLAARIHQPADDAQYIVVQLDFGDIGHAERFKTFLETTIWTDPEKSPALRGTPTARVLTAVDHEHHHAPRRPLIRRGGA